MSDKPKRPQIPSYRQRHDRALVTLTDSQTKRRRDYWLGSFDSPASRELYHRVIAGWEAGGRRWPSLCKQDPASDPNALTIAELVRQYWRWAKGYYHPRRAGAIKTVLRLLRKYYPNSQSSVTAKSRRRIAN